MMLSGKVAVVTGSSRGIGRGIALEMAKEGADITVNYLENQEAAQDVAESIRSLGRRAILCQADVSRRGDVENMVQAAIREFGKIDICVCNVGRSIRKPFLELLPQDFEWVINVSLMSVFHTSQLCAREMVKIGNGGAILIIGSVHSFIPIATSVPYNTVKAGLEQMSNTMAEELAPYKIRVNVLQPGWIDTPGERRHANDNEIRKGGQGIPWKRLGTTAEVGRAAVYLCSDDADYVTAACLRIDGGFWLPSRKAK